MLGLRGVEDVDAGSHEISFDGGLTCHWGVDHLEEDEAAPSILSKLNN
jgi:hypothetical protein